MRCASSSFGETPESTTFAPSKWHQPLWVVPGSTAKTITSDGMEANLENPATAQNRHTFHMWRHMCRFLYARARADSAHVCRRIGTLSGNSRSALQHDDGLRALSGDSSQVDAAGLE